MFKLAVILVHALIFILVTIIGLAGKYNPAPPDPGATYGIWFSTFAIFNILVLVSAFIQLWFKKVWVFLISIIGLLILFIVTLQYIYPYVYDLF
ncbi:MAG TPA: hypothetical protein VK079_02890 [Bacillota bacterium]|nr:hypothetical protein [Bacillota bacterium]